MVGGQISQLEHNFTYLEVSLLRHHGQDDGLHRGDISEPHLRNVEGADNVGPVIGVGALQCPLFTRAKLTSLGNLNGYENFG